MSRVGKKPIVIPNGVEVTATEGLVRVKGPKGTLERKLHPHVRVALTETPVGKELSVAVSDAEDPRDRALWGLFRALIQNMVSGVVQGFEKKLEVVGVGYKVSGGGKALTLDVGFSHSVAFPLPEGVTATVEKNMITLVGADKELVGETAARLRRIRKPEPYKGKGVKYAGEVIRRKAGKAAKAAAK